MSGEVAGILYLFGLAIAFSFSRKKYYRYFVE